MRRSIAALAATGLLILVACSETQESSDRPTGGASPTALAPEVPTTSRSAGQTPTPSPTPTRTPTRTPTPTPKPDPISVGALIQKSYDGDRLKRGRLLADVGPYKKYLVSYRSEGLTVSGVMLIPDGKGPFPVLVLNHGYIDPDRYFPGQGMPREHDYLARRGYVVLHTDYRGHASGDDDKDVDYELRLPYAVDTINAVYAVKRSTLDYLDGDRVGWLGRSMGGNVTLTALVAQPGLVDAAVVYASVSSLAADNWRRWYRDSDDRRAVNRRIERTYGLPEDNPRFWRAASSRPFFDRITEPVMVHHGTADDTCPIVWSERTVAALRKAGVDVTFHRYRGAGHTFEGSTWRRSIQRTTAFFDRHLS
jgi:dipeptidyl aminopeptidase/acylaminoacyl peptidase